MPTETLQPRLVIGGQAFELPVNDDQLWELTATVLGLEIPRLRVCPEHVAPFTAFADAYFARMPVSVWQGSRGLAGKSMLLAALAYTEQVFLGAGVSLLGGSGAQSKNVNRYIAQFWNASHAPRHLLVQGDPGTYETFLTNGGYCRALLASQTSVRGPHVPRLRLDEVDEMDLAILDAAMGQPMEGRERIPVQTVLSSTHQHPDGTWTEVKKRAAAKGWPLYTWCYRETLQPHGWLSQAEVVRKRGELTDVMWDVEVEQREPSATDRAITPAKVEAMFDLGLGEAAGAEGEELFFEAPVPQGTYATGADWGKLRNYSAIVTFRMDTVPVRLVAFKRDRKKPYAVMAPVFNARLRMYPGAGCHDAAGVGVAVGEHLTVPAVGYDQWIGRARHELFNAYVAAVERGAVHAPRIASLYEAHKYVTNNDLFGSGHPPDEFVACALAWHVRPAYMGASVGDLPVLQGANRAAAVGPAPEAAAGGGALVGAGAAGGRRGGLIL